MFIIIFFLVLLALSQNRVSVAQYRFAHQGRETTKEWDLNDPHRLKAVAPLRVDGDEGLGAGCIQVFQGEDPEAKERKKAQQAQIALWNAQVEDERRRLREAELAEDRCVHIWPSISPGFVLCVLSDCVGIHSHTHSSVFLFARVLLCVASQIAGSLAEADVAVLSMEAERKARLAVEKKRTQTQNIHAVDAKQQTLQALAEEKKRQEARDLETHLTSAWLTEQHPGHADGPHRKRADAFKGKCSLC